MWQSARNLAVAAVAAVVVAGALSAPVQAGTPVGTRGARVVVLPSSQSIINPYYRVGPQMIPLNQYTYNIRQLGRAYSQVPPWLYGYNPYRSPIYLTPSYMSVPYFYPYYSPFTSYGFPY
jgi:hypothetical protein